MSSSTLGKYAAASTTASSNDHGTRSLSDLGIRTIDDLPPLRGSSSVFTSIRRGMLQRRDSLFSVDSNYAHPPHGNDLNVLQGAALLTADCMGTGLLALPQDVRVLGRWIGLAFLVLNLPINLFAGTVLSDAAAHVERTQTEENELFDQRQRQVAQQQEQEEEELSASSQDGLVRKQESTHHHSKDYATLDQTENANNEVEEMEHDLGVVDRTPPMTNFTGNKTLYPQHAVHHDTATFDFIGMTQALFSSRRMTQVVMALFYTNIFLVLGDYILVMSHAVSALVGEDQLCIPQAGILASVLMYAVSQIRSMANLGRAATVVSLSALLVVVLQCLWAVHTNASQTYVEASSSDFDDNSTWLRKFSALGSIGFAMGSQKLFLNIRHELAERSKAPKCLAISLSTFVTVYVGIILLAGSDPPSFLFDAIPPGWNRRLAGLLLWIHVVVSYSINSQAICASMDRLFFGNIEFCGLHKKPRLRWMWLTAIMSLTAFVVANAIPFFKDLVALIGALTSLPLSLHLPVIFSRKYLQVPLCWPTRQTLWSIGLLAFASVFMAVALAGSISSIEMDWSKHAGAFACQG